MLSMLAIAASRSPPMVSADGSLNWREEACCAGAGEGVAGAFCVVAEEAGAGAAGVCAAAGAGVDGAALLAEGAVFGYEAC